MNRFAVIASVVCCALAAGACGSSSAPKPNTFAGTWVGYIEGDTITLNTTETSGALGGGGHIENGSAVDTVIVGGTATTTTVSAILTMLGADYSYDATFANADSTSGFLRLNTDSLPLSFKKH
jgi:hypothetical protein